MAWWCYKPKKTVRSPKEHADLRTEKQYPIFKTGRYGMSVPINSILSIYSSFHPFVKYHPSFVLLKWQSWWLITPEKPIRTTFDFFVCLYLV
jgi:hypothetical protein